MADMANLNLRHEARSLGIPLRQIQIVAELLDGGNTIPFIARFRKDQTGGLEEIQLRKIQERLVKLVQLNERKQAILRQIESQGLLTEELKEKIESAATSKRLEDTYLPYKPKQESLAPVAKERGLEPLADAILSAVGENGDIDLLSAGYVSEEKDVPSIQDALTGACHIIAQRFSENIELRQALREILQRTGKISTAKIESIPAEVVEKFLKAEENVAEEQTNSDSESELSEQTSEVSAETTPEGTENETSVSVQTEATPAEAQAEADQIAADVAEIDVAFALAQGALSEKDQVVVSKKATKRQHKAEIHAREVVAAGDVSTLQAEAQQKKKNKKALLEEKLYKSFSDYFQFSEDIRKIPSHRILAINRGELAKVLQVKLEFDNKAIKEKAIELLIPNDNPYADLLTFCIEDSLERLIMPSLEHEVRDELTERAETNAVDVFAKNLSNLLLQQPVHNKRILAIDPGFKSGCKLVALDQFGNFLDRNVIYLVGKKSKLEDSKKTVLDMITKNNVNVIAIGNGTACRESEEFIANLISTEEAMKDVSYVIVNESGASIYSTSPLAREEFPEFDASVRSSISIGRRLLDPLSELVKIDPANIGVGLYPHDLKTKNLKETLDNVVESCVNFVGVDVNLASPSLLRFVSGLNPLTARRIYEYRTQNGPFKNRQQLLQVPGIGEQTYTQAAGFLKIQTSDEPLDATWIHPENYETTKKILATLGFTTDDLNDTSKTSALESAVATVNVSALANELEIGELTLKDILTQLVRPGLDPRETLPPPVFKKGILKLEDLEPGMNLKGYVLNVVDFGAFIDIGMHDSGLVHVSELADKYIHDPHEVVAVGDLVDTWVVSVDTTRRRVSLTLIDPSKPRVQVQEHGYRRFNKEANQGDGEQSKRFSDKPRSDRPHNERPRRGKTEGERRERPEGERREKREFVKRDGNSRPERRDGEKRDNERRDRGSRREWGSQPREFISKTPVEPKKALTDKQKTGKEPMHSFGDLAELFKMAKDEK